MKVAIPTNNGKRVASHIALAKKFLIVDLETGDIEELTNPILEELKASNTPIPKEEPRRLGAGKILPPLLAEKGVKVLVAREINPKMEQNLNRFGIEGVETEIVDIPQLIDSLKDLLSIDKMNKEKETTTKRGKMGFFSRFGQWSEGMGYSRRLGWGHHRGRGCGGRCWRWRDLERNEPGFVMGRESSGFGFGFGRGRGLGFGRRDNRTRHFGKVIGRDISLLKEE
ncbi:MAG: iron-molybdenum cofactor-binding protein [Epsilonproteobacteria bacterium]|jgi:predicted Fe-Mo cluster-binding NifX family protein|nr:iron-molybdenum cofactor-binding protein [Campylobacterota bacterium]NPA89618.1 iron-molybdenum cofactor-binding protein [Campylobacterota bacterium]